jgi:hypothetical protein
LACQSRLTGALPEIYSGSACEQRRRAGRTLPPGHEVRNWRAL